MLSEWLCIAEKHDVIICQAERFYVHELPTHYRGKYVTLSSRTLHSWLRQAMSSLKHVEASYLIPLLCYHVTEGGRFQFTLDATNMLWNLLYFEREKVSIAKQQAPRLRRQKCNKPHMRLRVWQRKLFSCAKYLQVMVFSEAPHGLIVSTCVCQCMDMLLQKEVTI